MSERKVLLVHLTLAAEDWENLPLALGYATAAVQLNAVNPTVYRERTADDRELARRVVKRITALADALHTAHVTEER